MAKSKKQSEPTRAQLIKEADAWASRFVRLRDIDDDGLVRCYTCNKRFYPSRIQCGHFVGRANFSVRYDPMNMHGQCQKCNRFRSGEPGKYALRLLRDYGYEQFLSLLERGTIVVIPTMDELRDTIQHYQKLTLQLLEQLRLKAWW